MKKREPSCTVGGNVNCYSYYGEQYGGSLRKLEYRTCILYTERCVNFIYIRTYLYLHKETLDGVATMENSMEVPQKTKNRYDLAYDHMI